MTKPRDVQLSLGPWSLLQAEAQPIRIAVFVDEQGIDPALEWDAFDAVSLHALVRIDGEAVATGRLLPDGHIGRMAVHRQARHRGLGGQVLEALVGAARIRGDQSVELSAQCHAEAFYLKHGFLRQGEPYLEAGIEHIRMVRRLVP